MAVTVKAAPGAFPADAVLSVESVPAGQQVQADAAVEEVRGGDRKVAIAYTFDINVIDRETGSECQPAEGQNVSVSFALAEVADENLETSIYHVTEDESTGEMSAVALSVSLEDEVTAVVETDGFSLFIVEFTYDTLEYVLPGGTSVAMSEILTALGLSGEVTDVAVSDDTLFSASDETGEWIVTAHQAFDTVEWMRVTINGIVYEITVTDDGGISTRGEPPTVLNNDGGISTWAELQTALNNGGEITLTQDITAEPGDSALTVPSDVTVTLDLNGHDLTLCEGAGRSTLSDNYYCIIEIQDGGDLTLNGGGTISGGQGDGIHICKEASFIMNDGIITGVAKSGAYVEGIFTMHEGTILEPKLNGVYVRGTFVMDGGAITNPKDSGVRLSTGYLDFATGTDPVFTMNGGTITGASDGVSITARWYSNSYKREIYPRFTMNGGTISGNRSHGVYTEDEFTFVRGTITDTICMNEADYTFMTRRHDHIHKGEPGTGRTHRRRL